MGVIVDIFTSMDISQLCIIFSCVVVLHLKTQILQSKQPSLSVVSTQTHEDYHFAD